MAKYVVIGASAAGVGCATKLRDLDKTSEIVMIGADKELPCNRCLLSDILSGDKTESDIIVKDLDYFKKQNINVMLSTVVCDIFPEEKKIVLQNSEEIEYDKLFIGTGKSGFIPTIPGSKLAGVFSFYGIADVKAILKFTTENKVRNITIVGAGLTGLECADALSSCGFEINLIERASHVLPYQIDQNGAEFIQNLIATHGIRFYPRRVLEQILERDNNVCGVALSDSGSIQTDMIIFATGGKTNIELALRAGLNTTQRGIVTTSTMQTSNANIFAGGDCCMVNDLLTGQPVQSCLWPDAAMQGMVAAHGMVGIKKEYSGILIITSSNIFGTQFVTCGDINSTDSQIKQIIKSGPDFYHKFLVKDDLLVGFIMVGKVENVGMLRKSLIAKIPFQC